MNLSERLQQLKTQRNLLQKDIASSLNMSLRTYQRYESGEREPAVTALVDMSKYFNVSIDYLVGLTNNPNINL